MSRIYLGGDNARNGARIPEGALARALANYGVLGFTLIPAIGYWQGRREETWIIEVSGEAVGDLAACLRNEFDQDAVLYQEGSNPCTLV